VPDQPPPNNERDFMRVVKIGTSLSMGLMAAFLISLKQVHPSIEFRFGFGAIAAFLIAAVASWRFCAMLAGPDTSGEPRRRRFIVRWMVAFLGVSAVGTLLAFAYSLKDVSSQSRREVVEGTVIAVLVLAIGGWLIYRAFQFFEEQSTAELEQLKREREQREREEEK
jgi:hypothetical protein